MFVYFVRCSPHTAIISLYRINDLVFVMETECVLCAVTLNFYPEFRLIFGLEGEGGTPSNDFEVPCPISKLCTTVICHCYIVGGSDTGDVNRDDISRDRFSHKHYIQLCRWSQTIYFYPIGL